MHISIKDLYKLHVKVCLITSLIIGQLIMKDWVRVSVYSYILLAYLKKIPTT